MIRYSVFIFSLLLLLSTQAHASEETYQFDTDAQSALFFELTKELRCPMCQNQNIADSDAMIAADLRRKVYQLVNEGQSREQIIDYMKQRYGDFVYYQPPVNATTVWLWLLPVLFVLFGIVLVVRSRQQKPMIQDKAKLEAAEKLLEEDK
ncbi:cytochrome c-type biogenesis protein [Paraglaciecola polaris]|uniref:Cytochrome c-type biogenesis protein n=1 Tax=Paraglaciecola polaris LMG 21857 TaxID=1129793 RepID=K6ZT43_9ALTE|nr:cytochrome c-type biogenesis protein [Paraglaciecola polaris]GAC33452.1 cytochrome c-type biogenesis protein CcmH [Paraglaciecola polaris LMG 21857]